MIPVPPVIGNRQIFYLEIENSLQELKETQLHNWVAFVIEDNINNPILLDFADICIEKNVLYMCAAGKACSQIDDLFDMNMVMREIEGKAKPSWYKSDDDVLMTTWHHDFDEGFWFCTTQTSFEDHLIDMVLVVNLTDKDYLPRIQELTKLISEGWIPPD